MSYILTKKDFKEWIDRIENAPIPLSTYCYYYYGDPHHMGTNPKCSICSEIIISLNKRLLDELSSIKLN